MLYRPLFLFGFILLYSCKSFKKRIIVWLVPKFAKRGTTEKSKKYEKKRVFLIWQTSVEREGEEEEEGE